jgi:hypothetical protein
LIYAKNQKRPSLSFRHAARQSGREEKWETGDKEPSPVSHPVSHAETCKNIFKNLIDKSIS